MVINEQHHYKQQSFEQPEGIYLDQLSNYNIITNNNISNAGYGISLWSSSNNNITNNNISSQSVTGILIWASSNNNITGNKFVNDGILIQGSKVYHFNSHIIPDNNTVNGKPLYYYKDCIGVNIDGIPIGQLILANCTGVDVKNLQINNTDVGMEIAYSTKINITNNNIFNNPKGIYLAFSTNNNITNNNVTNNLNGISLSAFSNNNSITDNNLSSNNLDGIYIVTSSNNNIANNNASLNNLNGIRLGNSLNNTITNNNFYSNTLDGVYLYISSHNNTVIYNNVSSNNVYGIEVEGSSNNSIYHNNIIENVNQAKDNTNDNFWNDTYPSGGNYWSDYDEVVEGCIDDFDGATTPQTGSGGSDGICDNPYPIGPNGINYYPLKNSTKPPPPDGEPPTIDGVTAIPDPQEVYGFVNISAIVEDNEQVDGVWINIIDPIGGPLGNFSMIYDISNNRYYHNTTCSLLGMYSFTIWAGDTSDNWNYSSSQFSIVDTTPPEIAHIPPSTIEVNIEFTITATVTDNVAVGMVKLNYTDVNSNSYNVTMSLLGGTYTYTIPAQPTTGILCYFIWADDILGNENRTEEYCVLVVDTTPPTINDVTAIPDPQEVNGIVNISAIVEDNYQLYWVWANITDPAGGPAGNFSMSYDAVNNRFYHNSTYSTLGAYTFIIWANDTSDNWNYEFGSFVIQDSSLPQAIADVSPPYWKNTSTFAVAWTASDNLGLSNITLLYRYSPDNSSWTPWLEYSYNDTISGTFASGTFQFTTPAEGHYEFFANASDIDNNWEPDAPSAEAIAAVDTAPPSSILNTISSYWRSSSPLSLDASANDGLSGVRNVTLWYRYSSDNVSWNPWEIFEADETEPWSWTFDFPGGEGYYEHYSIGRDNASNVESKALRDALCAYDTTPPTAYAGDNQTIGLGTTANFDGSDSSDNFGIISNYTWTITKNLVYIATLYGPNPTYTFDIVGDYEVTLTVEDPSRNSNNHSITVSVVTDSEAPAITHSASPEIQEVYESVNITAVVTDNVEVFGVWVQIFNPNDNELWNLSMFRIGLTDNYWFLGIYSILGTYSYIIWTNDTSDNSASDSGSFVIQDTTLPVANAGDDQKVIVGDRVYFNGSESIDNGSIVNYSWNISLDGTLIKTLYGVNTSYVFEKLGIYEVTLTVRDAAGNIDTDAITVNVASPEGPNYWWILVILIVAIVIIVLLLLMRKRKKAEKIPKKQQQGD